jgi:predicted nucleic acid-binding protein
VEDILADTNVLLRSIESTEQTNDEAIIAIKTLLKRGHRVSILPQNLIEFWNVATRPVDKNGFGWSVVKAEYEISRLETLLTVLPDTDTIYPQWRELVFNYEVKGKSVHDARIVAAMMVHHISKVLTFNGQDFKRFQDIVVIDPSSFSGSFEQDEE